MSLTTQNASIDAEFVADNFAKELDRLNLKPKDVANLLGVSTRTVQRWCVDVAIPADKLGAVAMLGINISRVCLGSDAGKSEIKIDSNLFKIALTVACTALEKGASKEAFIDIFEATYSSLNATKTEEYREADFLDAVRALRNQEVHTT